MADKCGKAIKAYYNHGEQPTMMKLIGRLKDDEHSWFAHELGWNRMSLAIVKFDKLGDRIWKIIDDDPLNQK